MADLSYMVWKHCFRENLLQIGDSCWFGKKTHRAKINPDRWDSHFRDEIRYCYPVGASDTKLEKSHLIKV